MVKQNDELKLNLYNISLQWPINLQTAFEGTSATVFTRVLLRAHYL